MEAEPSGEQAVAKGDLNDVILGHSGAGKDAGHQIGPVFYVVAAVTDDRGQARGSGGRMHPDHIPERHGKEPVGVVIAQILLDGERQTPNIIQTADILKIKLELGKFFLIKRHMGSHPVQGGLQTFQL